MDRAVFLDRDGTINEEMGYINHLSRFKIFDFAFEAVQKLNKCGFKVFILTNQSGLARGYFDEQLLDEVHDKMLSKFQEKEARIEKIYYCPHHKDGIVEKYKTDCDCRKPKPGLLNRANKEFRIDITKSYMIGDRYKDVEFGFANELKTIMLLTGYGLGEYTYQQKQWSRQPDFICKNILEAAELICQIET